MRTSFKNILVKIIMPMVGIILVVVAAIVGYNAINNQAPESRSQQQMVVAPVATATPMAPVATATTAPAPVATPAPAAEETEAVQAEVTPAPVAVASNAGVPEVPSTSDEDENVLILNSSSELQLVGQTNSGKPYTRLIRKEDLAEFGQYRIVKVLDWTEGVELAFNSERILGKFWGMKMSRGYAAKDMPQDFGHDPQVEWLMSDGSLRGSNARNGWDKSGRSGGRILFLHDLFVVEQNGEMYWVVEGNPAAPRSGSGSSSNGSSSSSSSSGSSNGSSTNNGGSSQKDPALTIPNDGHLTQQGQAWLDGGKDTTNTTPVANGGITIGGNNPTTTPAPTPANDGITIGGGNGDTASNGGITIGNGGSANDGITIGGGNGAVSQPEADSALSIGGNTNAQPRLTIGGNGGTTTDGITIGQ